jgi:hypothetical protein
MTLVKNTRKIHIDFLSGVAKTGWVQSYREFDITQFL